MNVEDEITEHSPDEDQLHCLLCMRCALYISLYRVTKAAKAEPKLMVLIAVQVASTQSSMTAGPRFQVLPIKYGALISSYYMRNQVLPEHCLGSFDMHDQVRLVCNTVMSHHDMTCQL